MYEAGKSANIAEEMERYSREILGLCETRWTQAGQMKINSGKNIIYAGHEEENAPHTEGVAIMLSKQAEKALIGWGPINFRIIWAKFRTSNKRINLNVIMCFAPTNDADEEKKEEFYTILQTTMRNRKEREMTLLMGDLNAKVGADNLGYERIMGLHGKGVINESGQLFVDFCAENNLVTGGTIFPHKNIHKTTWVSPDHRTENQIDHICISAKFRRSLLDVRAMRGADAASDHFLVVLKLRLKKCMQNNSRMKYDVERLKDGNTIESFKLLLQNKYQIL